jgi:MraZ protein
MSRFASHFLQRIDAKGRVSVPAPFRQVLAQDGHEGLYCFPALDQPAIEAGGHALRREIEAWIAEYPAFSPEQEDLSFFLETQGQVLSVDPEGRILLPEALRAHAGISDAVIFAGQGHRFQLWNPAGFAARLAAAMDRVRALKAARGQASGARP